MAKGDTERIQQQNEALKQRNYLLEAALKTQQESLDLSSSLTDSIKETLGISTKKTTADANLLKINKDINKAIMDQKSGLAGIDVLNKRIAKNNDVIVKAKNQEVSLEKTIGEAAVKKADRAVRAFEIAQNAQKELEKALVITDEQGKLDQKAINAAIAKEAKASSIADKQMKSLGNLGEQLVFTKLNTQELEKQNKERKKELKLAEEIEDKLGVAGKLGDALGAIPGVGKFASKAVGSVTKELEEAAEAGEELPSKGRIAGKVFKEMGKNLIKDLTDPFTIATALATKFFKVLTEVDKSSGEFAKNQGISYQESVKLRGEMSDVAFVSKDILVSSQALMETQASLNKFFGQSVKFSGKLAEDMTSIAKRTNMSEESQGLFALETLKSGKDAKELLKTQNLQVMEMNKQKGLNLSFKQVQDAIGKTSKALQLTFKGSTKELTKQVMSAKALGANMDTVNSIASSLLDFEGSIQAELEAELLLGKEINLEKARQAALEGDMGKVADEVLKNKAIMNAFETKNVIAQEAAAKALGMSRDQLAEMVHEQEKQKTLQDAFGDKVTDMNSAQAEYNRLSAAGELTDAKKQELADAGLLNQLESVSQAEKLEAAMTRVSEIFVQMAEPVLGLVDKFMNFVGGADKLAGIITGIAVTFATIKGLTMAINAASKIQIGIQTTLALITGTKAAAEMTAASALTLGVGIIAVIAGITAGIAAMNSAKATSKQGIKDGMIAPDGGLVVSGAKGTFQLDKQDSVIAGTELNKPQNTPTPERGGSSKSNDALISKIDQLIAVNQKILAKSPIIEMAGNEVGQGINTDSRAVQ